MGDALQMPPLSPAAAGQLQVISFWHRAKSGCCQTGQNVSMHSLKISKTWIFIHFLISTCYYGLFTNLRITRSDALVTAVELLWTWTVMWRGPIMSGATFLKWRVAVLVPLSGPWIEEELEKIRPLMFHSTPCWVSGKPSNSTDIERFPPSWAVITGGSAVRIRAGANEMKNVEFIAKWIHVSVTNQNEYLERERIHYDSQY